VSRDIVCFSHLRWDFVYQRPNHLMARAARDGRVFFVEEPMLTEDSGYGVQVRENVVVVTPSIRPGLEGGAAAATLRAVIDAVVREYAIQSPVLWYYTPMSLPWTRHLEASVVVYDSMDNLAGFLGAPIDLLGLEEELLARADLVFTGGTQLQARLADRHPAVHRFASSVDAPHFAKARERIDEPTDQAGIPSPRIGYAGVIDERIDLSLIAGVAAARPRWQILLLGPTAKIDPAAIPSAENIHRLGRKDYSELPSYLGGWDAGWMPFALNDATRYISPTKTPEYLAAGLPVVSTSITDVVEPYGRAGLVEIADDVTGSIEALERALHADLALHRSRSDAFLATDSWDLTWASMATLIDEHVGARDATAAMPTPRPCRPRRTRESQARSSAVLAAPAGNGDDGL